MNNFSISDIESLTGIKAHTLRIWEHRYNILHPKRKKGLHRQYDNEDLKHILRISYLYNNGYKISRIAALPDHEIKRLTLEYQSSPENYSIYINQLSEASFDFDQENFEKILKSIIHQLGFEESIIHVLFPLLNRIGMLWLINDVSPAQEHFASALVIKKMIVAIDGLKKPPYKLGDRKVMLFTPEKEYHEIPLLFMHYLLKRSGIATCYAGKNTSLETLQVLCDTQHPSQLYLHVITYFLDCDIQDYLLKLSSLFPEKKIYVSSQQIVNVKQLPLNVHLLSDPASMLAFAK